MQSALAELNAYLMRTLPGASASFLTTLQERTSLDDKLDDLKNDSNNLCLGKLESMTGLSFDQIKTNADNIQYYDLTGAAGSLFTSDVGIDGANSTLLAFFNNSPTPRTAGVPGNLPIVLLGSSFFTGSIVLDNKTFLVPTDLAFQQQTLFHELWHVLGIADLGGSVAFDNWLSGGCKGAAPQ